MYFRDLKRFQHPYSAYPFPPQDRIHVGANRKSYLSILFELGVHLLVHVALIYFLTFVSYTEDKVHQKQNKNPTDITLPDDYTLG